jgi:hypothetical protein
LINKDGNDKEVLQHNNGAQHTTSSWWKALLNFGNDTSSLQTPSVIYISTDCTRQHQTAALQLENLDLVDSIQRHNNQERHVTRRRVPILPVTILPHLPRNTAMKNQMAIH